MTPFLGSIIIENKNRENFTRIGGRTDGFISAARESDSGFKSYKIEIRE